MARAALFFTYCIGAMIAAPHSLHSHLSTSHHIRFFWDWVSYLLIFVSTPFYVRNSHQQSCLSGGLLSCWDGDVRGLVFLTRTQCNIIRDTYFGRLGTTYHWSWSFLRVFLAFGVGWGVFTQQITQHFWDIGHGLNCHGRGQSLFLMPGMLLLYTYTSTIATIA